MTTTCCEKWETAQHIGSANGEFGLIVRSDGEFVFESINHPQKYAIRFCPWCGRQKPIVRERYLAWKREQAANGFTHPPGEWVDPPWQFLGDMRVAGGTITGRVSAVQGDCLLYDGSKWVNMGQPGSTNVTPPSPGPDTGTHA
jgi:hypothetical protein